MAETVDTLEHEDDSDFVESREQPWDKCLYFGFIVLVAVLPLIISYKITYDQFDLAKVTFLRIATVFLLFCYIAKLITEKKGEIKRTSLDYPVLIFLGLVLLSTIFSVHPLTSLFGKYRRYDGLLTYLNYGIIFFLAAQFFKDTDRIKVVAYSMVVTAAVISIYGLLQYLGFDFLKWLSVPFEFDRSFATFGNPTLLGGYLVIILPVSMGLFFSASDVRDQIILGISLVLIFSCLIVTFTRAAWIGGLFNIICFFIFSWKQIKAKKQIYITAACLLLIAAALLVKSSSFFTTSDSEASRFNVDISERITSGVSMQGSALTRIMIWEGALKMIKARPLLGFGPDCFRLIMRKYQSLEYKRLVGESAIADNAHNYILQLASMMGIPATIAFIAILGFFIFSARNVLLKFSEQKEYPLLVGIAVSIFGYLIHLLFGISVVGSTTFLWIILGIIAGLSSDSEIDFEWSNYRSLRVSLLIAVSIIAFLLASLSLFPFIGDYYFDNGNELAVTGYYERSVVQYEKAMQFNPYLDTYPYELGALNMKWAAKTKEVEYFNLSVQALETARDLNPLEVKIYAQLGLIYLFGGRNFDPSYYVKAKYTIEKALELEPYSSYAYYLLGVEAGENKEYEEGVKYLKKAVDIAPNYEDAYYYLGFFYEQLNQNEEAIKSYRKTVSLNSDNEGAKKALERLKKSK